MKPNGGRAFSSGPIVVFVLVLALEFFLFDHFGSHRVTTIYPRWNDQIQYLSEAYTGYEYTHAHGLGAGLWHTLVNPSAQGTLHDSAALILFQFVGASRSAALALNMLAFIAWQAALLGAVWRRTGSWEMAFLTAALPLAVRGPWQDIPGSAYDFRLDHLAMCALGVTSAIAVSTDGMRTRTWSIVLGIATGVTLLTRFLTGTYFVVILLGLLALALVHRDRLKRVTNVMLAAATAAIIAGPIFWLNREWVWNYYYIGHYVGPESAIRNQNFGIVRSLDFVWSGLTQRHLGLCFVLVTVFVGVGALLIRWSIRPVLEPTGTAEPNVKTLTAANVAFVGLLFLVAPALVLTLHPQKSEVVLGGLVPGVVLIAASAWLAIAGSVSLSVSTARARWRLLTAVATGAILAYFGLRQTLPFDNAQASADSREANAVADYVLQHSSPKTPSPRIAVDFITDALDAQVMRVICYERHHVWRDFDMTLPTGIAEPDASLVRQRIADSDFVLLSSSDTPAGRYPFDQKLAAMRPELRAWCDTHLQVVRRFPYSGHSVTLYQRADLN